MISMHTGRLPSTHVAYRHSEADPDFPRATCPTSTGPIAPHRTQNDRRQRRALPRGTKPRIVFTSQPASSSRAQARSGRMERVLASQQPHFTSLSDFARISGNGPKHKAIFDFLTYRELAARKCVVTYSMHETSMTTHQAVFDLDGFCKEISRGPLVREPRTRPRYLFLSLEMIIL